MILIYEGISPDSKGLHYILKTGRKGDILVINPKTKKREAIRYASNQPSIWIKDQDGPSILPAIVMKEGYLKVESEDEAQVEFLKRSPQNGIDFRLVVPERDAEERLAKEELEIDITMAIRNKSKEKYGEVALASLLLIKSKKFTVDQIDLMGPTQIREKLYNLARSSPKTFLNEKKEVSCFDDGDFIRQHLIIRALNKNVIKINLSGREISWKNDEPILTVPEGKDYREFFANHFLTREGEKTMNTIGVELEKIYKE